MLKARILLKADASEAGEAWSDGQIAEALDTSIDTIARVRQQLVPRKRIFDGVGEAKLIALACSSPPKNLPQAKAGGRKRWTLIAHPVLLREVCRHRNWHSMPDCSRSLAAIFIAPPFIFTPIMMTTWRRAAEYGALAEQMGIAFSRQRPICT